MVTEDFSQLFRTHAPFVWRALRRHGVPESDLEDACQEVFLVLYRRRADFDERSTLRTWLFGIARKVAAGRRRAARARPESCPQPEREPLGTTSEDAEASIDRARSLRWLEDALSVLAEDKREVFILYELELLTLKEVAKAVACNETTALYRLEAARAELRKALARRALVNDSTAARTRSARGQVS